ncbi:unnamed protein product [Linum tenue]|nr:unnamed protein product [Linum tenue]
MMIGQAIGIPIRVDRATELGARGKFARVCVEVDLTKPLLSQFKIEGVTYLIQYEGIENICSNCGMYGKKAHQCQCQNLMQTGEDEDMQGTGQETPPTNPTEGQVYGEWMTVRKKRLIRREASPPLAEKKGGVGDDRGGRFHVLHGYGDDVEVGEKGNQAANEKLQTRKSTVAGKNDSPSEVESGSLQDRENTKECPVRASGSNKGGKGQGEKRKQGTKTGQQGLEKNPKEKGGNRGEMAGNKSGKKGQESSPKQRITVNKDSSEKAKNTKGAGNLSPSGHK